MVGFIYDLFLNLFRINLIRLMIGVIKFCFKINLNLFRIGLGIIRDLIENIEIY